VDSDGEPRPLEEAAVGEITSLLPASTLGAYPAGTRVIVRRERAHPGAQLDLVEQRDGYRYTRFATDTRVGQHAFLDARHRAHLRVEDRICCGPRHRPLAPNQPILRDQRRLADRHHDRGRPTHVPGPVPGSLPCRCP
jgi:hypothetical protein